MSMYKTNIENLRIKLENGDITEAKHQEELIEIMQEQIDHYADVIGSVVQTAVDLGFENPEEVLEAFGYGGLTTDDLSDMDRHELIPGFTDYENN